MKWFLIFFAQRSDVLLIFQSHNASLTSSKHLEVYIDKISFSDYNTVASMVPWARKWTTIVLSNHAFIHLPPRSFQFLSWWVLAIPGTSLLSNPFICWRVSWFVVTIVLRVHGFSTVCPRSSGPFYILSYYIRGVSTSWTYSMNL